MSAESIPVSPETNAMDAQSYRRTLIAMVLFISAAAALEWLWRESVPCAELISSPDGQRSWGAAGLFWVDWLLMCTAMFMPTTMSLLAAVRRCTSRCADSSALVAVCAVGFLGVWLAVGVAVRIGGGGVLQAVAQSSYQQEIFAGILALVGVYLFMPVAHNCVKACRSPIGFIAKNWTGRPDVRMQVARIGVQYGWSCFGCCWPLWVVMSVLGLFNPVWMLLLTLVLLFQEQSRYGHWLTYGMGSLLLICAGSLASGAVSLPMLGVSTCRV